MAQIPNPFPWQKIINRFSLNYNNETDEKQIECVLPVSYKNFLYTTNGLVLNSQKEFRLFSTEEIDWFYNTDKEICKEWQEILEGANDYDKSMESISFEYDNYEDSFMST